MIIAISSAVLCVITRALLNVFDRHIFKKVDSDFLKSIALNAFFPFLVSVFFSLVFGEKSKYFFSYMFQKGVFLSALGAQMAAAAFSYSFKSMSVRTVVISAKVADIFIPLVIWLVSSQINLTKYFFAFISTLLFLPIFLQVVKNKTPFYFKISLTLALVLFFQAGINSYFQMNRYANTWPKFLSLMSCILFWRALFVGTLLFFRWLKSVNKNYEKKKVAYFQLLCRAFLAFISQASFFYGITRVSGDIAWPILNSAPLVSCFAARVFLKEDFGKRETSVLASFVLFSIIYVYFIGK